MLSFPNADRRKIIFALALPIVGGMVSQNVVNLVDTYMVGSLGDAALAATGMGGFANWLSLAFIIGLATGVQTIASRRMGEGRLTEMALPLNGGLLQAIVLGVPMSAFMIWATPAFFPLLVNDPEVYALGIPYLQLRLLGLTFVAMNFAFRGYWNGVNLSRLYMGTLVTMHVVNIVLNFLLIHGNLGFPAMGVRGAAVGTAVSNVVGTAIYFGLGLKHARKAGFLSGIPSLETMTTMLRLAIPSGVQQLFFAGGMTAFMWILGKTGTAQLAASNVIINLILVAILPAMGFGLAAASLVGQALGRKEPEEARRWGWEVATMAAVVVGAVTLPTALVPDLVLGLFLHDPDTIALGRVAFQVAAAGMAIDAVGSVLMTSHFGAGAVGRATVVSVGLQWLFFLPTLFVLVTQMGVGIVGVWVAQAVYRGIQAVIFAWSWHQGKWANVKL